MSLTTTSIAIVPPALPDAPEGTVIGAAEVLDHSNRCLARVTLRSGMSALVDIPRDERCLVHGWSPYLSLQPLIVTGGTSQRAVLSARRANPGAASREQTNRGASGWVQLWSQDTNGRWTVRDPSEMATDRGGPTVASPPGGPAALQVGGTRRRPVCTLVPEYSLFLLRPADEHQQTQVEVRPVADSGFTLLEALRCGEWTWASLTERVWWDDPGARGAPLFDLAAGYAACRRGDLEQAERWWLETQHRHTAGPAEVDTLVIEAWLARRRGEGRQLATVLERLTATRGAPLAAEGLDILAAELARPADDSLARKRAKALHQRLGPYLRAAQPSSLTSFTAVHPDRPEPRSAKGARPDRPLPFKLDAAVHDLRIEWRALSQRRPGPGEYGLAAGSASAHMPAESAALTASPDDVLRTLVIEGPAPILLWRLSRTLTDKSVATVVSFVPDRDAVAVVFPERQLRHVADQLTSLLRKGAVERLSLSVGTASHELSIADADEAAWILRALLHEGQHSLP
ncbi:hypothetical protein AB0940_29130 [Streptomyces sp. NPDC006656]|uniref:hypothetical protein n=1 Tax=Streptomyces sp. NPDC006656 TaxID=3156899 RepID=UPI003454D454